MALVAQNSGLSSPRLYLPAVAVSSHPGKTEKNIGLHGTSLNTLPAPACFQVGGFPGSNAVC